MESKLLMAVIVLMAAGRTFAMPDDDVDIKIDHPDNHEEMKKFLSAMEKIDIDKILNNTRLMMNNIKCFLDEGPCSAQLKEMKKAIPMLIKESCSFCTKEQKMIIKKSMEKVKALRPNEYEKLSKFFDPEGIYEKKFLESYDETE